MEIWKPIRNFPSYNASSEGRIMNVRTQRIMKTGVDSRGRVHVCLRKNGVQHTVSVHKLIADTFLGEHSGLDIRHRDLDKTNNRVENLYFSTRSETIQDAFDRGSKKPKHITPVRIIETGDVFDSVSECSRHIGCDKSEIFSCMRGFRDNVKGYHFERL